MIWRRTEAAEAQRPRARSGSKESILYNANEVSSRWRKVISFWVQGAWLGFPREVAGEGMPVIKEIIRWLNQPSHLKTADINRRMLCFSFTHRHCLQPITALKLSLFTCSFPGPSSSKHTDYLPVIEPSCLIRQNAAFIGGFRSMPILAEIGVKVGQRAGNN